MKYKYNGHLTFEERVDEVANEIIKVYPVDKETALKLAAMEEVISSSNIIDIKYKRLSNILRYVNDENIKSRVIKDILNEYKNEKEKNTRLDDYISNLVDSLKYNLDLPIY
ncbi:MAG: hypothetical protein IIZ40_01245 [Bacilli bacterium]|nr:hypothetical protein [Bacilli bacterium]